MTLMTNSQGAQTVNTTTPAPTTLPNNLEHVLYMVRTRIDFLVPRIFVDLAISVEISQRELIEATLTNKKALDTAKILNNDMASQLTANRCS